ncbi:MAG: hypothetical protein R2856_31060 [Caldilineaceae bacterium]
MSRRHPKRRPPACTGGDRGSHRTAISATRRWRSSPTCCPRGRTSTPSSCAPACLANTVFSQRAEEMYFPDVWGRSAGALFTVTE